MLWKRQDILTINYSEDIILAAPKTLLTIREFRLKKEFFLAILMDKGEIYNRF